MRLPAAVVYAVVFAELAPTGMPRRDSTARVSGRVLYQGAVPAPTIVMEGGGTQQVLYVHEGGALEHAVAFIRDAPATQAVPPAAPAVMNQRNFMFEPQVLAVRAGTPVRFTNDDPANHNVRSTDANPANRFSLYTGTGAAERQTLTPNAGARPVVVGCDIHPWMRAWIYVFDHPHFAVTEATGRFGIENLPPGRYTLSVVQPAGGLRRDVGIEVRAGATQEVRIVFTPADLSPARP